MGKKGYYHREAGHVKRGRKPSHLPEYTVVYKKIKGEFVPISIEGVLIDQRQLKRGIKVEKEHTQNKRVAQKIALDHLKENPRYYDYLDKMEKAMNKGKSLEGVEYV